MTSEERKQSKKAYDLKYKAKNIVKRVVDFNKGSEEDMKILGHLDAQKNKAQYVKGLIKQDMPGE